MNVKGFPKLFEMTGSFAVIAARVVTLETVAQTEVTKQSCKKCGKR